MAVSLRLKDMSAREEALTSGHRLCPGCAEPIIIRQITKATDRPIVITNATGCLEVSSTTYPFTAWTVPWIHSAFENTASTASGVEAAYKALKKKGVVTDEIKLLSVGGDGALYDIGFGALSGAWERGHDIVHICLNNEAYMNTGIQRSSATPQGAWTTTSPVGSAQVGKTENRKDLTMIAAAHRIPYVAQASPSRWRDLIRKAQKAFETSGPAFLNVLSSCPRGWRHPPNKGIEISQLAINSCYWPLYEIENGKLKITYKPKEKLPVTEWFKPQGRFRHLLDPQNKELVEQIQAYVDDEWEKLLVREKADQEG